MGIGDVQSVDIGGVSDCYYVDTGMFDTPEYTSVYIIDADRPAVIDTGIGTDHELILDALSAVDIRPADLEVIAPTHVHLDHAGGAGFLAAACPNATVTVPSAGANHLISPDRLVEGTKRAVGEEWKYYADPKPVPADRVREIDDGDYLDLGDRELEVHGAPGHAPHQVVFFDPDEAVAFTADAAGIYVPALDRVVPTTPPPNFDLEQCLNDVSMLQSLEPEVLCYPHFGPADTADRLGTYATVLESWVDEVRRAREQHESDEAVVDYLVAETDLHEAWGERRAAVDAELNARGVLHALDRGAA